MAGFSLLAAVPGAGDAAGAAKVGVKAVKAGGEALEGAAKLGSKAEKAVKAVKGVDKIDANKLHHIFDNKDHLLDDFVDIYGGDQVEAFRAIEDAARRYAETNRITDTFETVIKVDGHDITVRGKIVDGTIKIATAFIEKGA